MDYFEDKLSRNECFRYDCGRKALHSILWKCPAGHSMEILRCGKHIAEDVRCAVEGTGSTPCCNECPEFVAMHPVLEGA